MNRLHHLVTHSLLIFLVGVIPVLAQTTGQTAASSPALTNKDVLEMLKAGLTEEIVVAKIKASACAFDTSPAELSELKGGGVPDAVILTMVNAPVSSKADTPSGPILRTAYIRCVATPAISLYNSPENAVQIAYLKCGTKVSILEEGESFDKVRTEDGKVGYISNHFVPKDDGAASSPPSDTATSKPIMEPAAQNNYWPAGMLRAVAWRAVPQATTSYFQQPGRADTDCTGSGTWSGNIWLGNSTCTTQYTPAQNIPITWQHTTVYNLVETSDSRLVIACTWSWSFSKCGTLIPGSEFSYELKEGKIFIQAKKTGKKKFQTLKMEIVSSEPKPR